MSRQSLCVPIVWPHAQVVVRLVLWQAAQHLQERLVILPVVYCALQELLELRFGRGRTRRASGHEAAPYSETRAAILYGKILDAQRSMWRMWCRFTFRQEPQAWARASGVDSMWTGVSPGALVSPAAQTCYTAAHRDDPRDRGLFLPGRQRYGTTRCQLNAVPFACT